MAKQRCETTIMRYPSLILIAFVLWLVPYLA